MAAVAEDIGWLDFPLITGGGVSRLHLRISTSRGSLPAILTRWWPRHSLRTQPCTYAGVVPCLRSSCELQSRRYPASLTRRMRDMCRKRRRHGDDELGAVLHRSVEVRNCNDSYST